MATILLSAAGAAIGGSVGGSVLGLSMTAVGRFVGASLGRSLDQRLMGQGSDAIEVGKMDRLRLTGVGEGVAIAQVFGRMRVGGHVIWATEFKEKIQTKGGGGKGAPQQPDVKKYSYSVSLALALCEGEITGVNRIWADGAELPISDFNMRVYRGTQDQLPDPKIEAVEGAGTVPAYRGTSYVVIESMKLARFGNRVPQFSFEVTRPELADAGDVPNAVEGVALIPGTGEYSLATKPVFMKYSAAPDSLFSVGEGGKAVANINTPSEQPDLVTSLTQLQDELPNCGAASLIVSWFGNDLRAGECEIRPMVEQTDYDAPKMPWTVCGINRDAAQVVPQEDDRPVYGGTPTDQSVIQSIRKMTDDGLAVMYYPFILMDQMAGNTLIDPYTGAAGQPALPWRGRITTSLAPGLPGSPDGTASADAEVAAFFGTATAADFATGGDSVSYTGPAEWSYSRFILHQAALCVAAGGVESFCIGSEMRGLTQIRGDIGFPAVTRLGALAAECRALLGPNVKIGYAADWSEYFGYQPQDGSGDLYFHLDPLWADPEIDFIGIDNYMPLSDWREGQDHADAGAGSIYDLDYLTGNVAGGEGYDWYYASAADRDAQIRSPISDGAYGEPWVYRYKDIRNWWENAHHERIGGVRQGQATQWQPRSKPVWFTELGCATIDKGTNQPNKFLDPKSSESTQPHYSNGLRDELIQRQYLRAMYRFWNDPANNPISASYGGEMIDMARAFVWAWDARPHPWFPGNEELWSDGPNYRRGHWLNGRASARTLASVVSEICHRVGLTEINTNALHGIVRGYVVPSVSDGRRALQPLMLAYGFDAIERDGRLVFRMRQGVGAVDLAIDTLVRHDELDSALVETRAGEAEMAGRVRVSFALADADHQMASEETVLPDNATHAVAETDLSLSMTRAEGRQTAERWLAEARIARDTVRFALPPSQLALGAGDIVRLPTSSGSVLARIDRVEVTEHQTVDAVRIEPELFESSAYPEEAAPLRPFTSAVPVTPLFLDLPLMRGDEVEHAPHLALDATPWPGTVAVYDSALDADYGANGLFSGRSIIGITQTPMGAAPAGRLDRGAALDIRLASGVLQSVSDAQLLGGANLMAIGDGTSGHWELFQFRDAELISQGHWRLSHRLRGQAGSDGIMPEVWPEGSYVVLMDGTPEQIDLASGQRRIDRHYRIGPAQRPLDDESYVHQIRAFDGVGLRPYRPAHLRVEEADGALDLRWIRRTRIEGDDWTGYDVPLGEDREAYLLQVVQNGTVLREAEVVTPSWRYTSEARAQDAIAGPYEIRVAQISGRFGAGPFAIHALIS